MKIFVLDLLVLSLISRKSEVNPGKAEQPSKKEVITEKTSKKVEGVLIPIEKPEVVDGHW